MTSTPVSINDESLNGSWIDIHSASQIHSPMDDDAPDNMNRPPFSLADSVQNLGLISFQVERFLQEAQRSNNNSGQNNNPNCDNISDLYLSDSDVSIDGLQESRAMIENLRRHHQHRQQSKQQQQQQQPDSSNNQNSNDNQNFLSADILCRTAKSGECSNDQVSDSLSMLSRASLFGERGLDQAAGYHDTDWFWDWSGQPEYFTGQEWKVNGPKQEYLLRQRQLYSANLQGNNMFSGEMMSLLVLTNLLSIIIGAGLTYSILMRRSNV